MKITEKLINLNGKKNFIILREKSPFFCNALKDNVHVSRQFLDHITLKKRRADNAEETAKRLTPSCLKSFLVKFKK